MNHHNRGRTISSVSVGLLVGLLSSWNAPTSQWEDVVAEYAPKASSVDSIVRQVATGGIWQDGDSVGRFRIVVVGVESEHTMSLAFAQWLQLDRKTGEHRIIASAPIKEFNERVLAMQNVQCDFDGSTSGNGVFELRAYDYIPDKQRRAIVTMHSVGKYDLKFLDGGP